jgi:hypothetical protein
MAPENLQDSYKNHLCSSIACSLKIISQISLFFSKKIQPDQSDQPDFNPGE